MVIPISVFTIAVINDKIPIRFLNLEIFGLNEEVVRNLINIGKKGLSAATLVVLIIVPGFEMIQGIDKVLSKVVSERMIARYLGIILTLAPIDPKG